MHERPAENIRVEFGDFDAGILVVQQQNGRTDFVYGAKNDPALVAPNELAHIGPVSAAIFALLNVLSGTEDVFAGSLRLAFSPIVVRRGVDNAEVNTLISAHTRLPLERTDTDILWSVNRPLSARTFAGKINRVIKWQSITLQSFSLAAGSQGFVPAGSTQMTKFARLELDVNSINDGQPLVPLPSPWETMSEIIDRAMSVLLGTES